MTAHIDPYLADCEPNRGPNSVGDEWTCPGCGDLWVGVDMTHVAWLPDTIQRSLKPETLGWVSTSNKSLHIRAEAFRGWAATK